MSLHVEWDLELLAQEALWAAEDEAEVALEKDRVLARLLADRAAALRAREQIDVPLAALAQVEGEPASVARDHLMRAHAALTAAYGKRGVR